MSDRCETLERNRRTDPWFTHSRRPLATSAAITLLLAIIASIVVRGSLDTGPARAASLTVGSMFPPPVLTDPVTIPLHVGEDHLRLSDTRDYVLVLPNVKKTGVLEIRGGRNVVVVGGYLSISATGSNIIVADGAGAVDGRVVHLEGLLIDGSSGAQSDGIRINAPKAIVQIVRTRIVDLRGSAKGLHADVIQPFGGVKELRIDGFTGSSHYNNLYLRRENDPLRPPIGKVTIYNANLFGYWNGANAGPPETLRAISIGTQPIDPSNTTSSINCQLTAPVVLRNVYIQPARKRPAQFVYPHDRMSTAGCPARVSADGKTVSWPALARIVDGSLIVGGPPTGDIVKASSVGLSYQR